MKRQAARPRKKCNRCYSVSSPEAMRCSVCQSAFAMPAAQISNSQVIPQQVGNKSLALSSRNSNGDGDFLFTSDDVDLLFSLNNFTDVKKEESKKACPHCQAENLMSATACVKCEFTFNTMPFLLHPMEHSLGRKKFKTATGKYLAIFFILMLFAAACLGYVYYFN